MNSRFFLGAYWTARKESIEQSVDRLYRFLSELSACDTAFAAWYEKGRSRRKALQKRVDIGSRDYLLSLLERGRSRRDIDKTVMDDLGFLVGLWNGAATEEKECGLGISCGLYATNPGLCNSVVLDLPEDLRDLRKPERMAAVLASVVTAWEPDSGGVMSNAAMKAKDYKVTVPFLDWMLYLSNRLVPQVPLLPQPARVQQVERLGSIIVVQDEPPDPANPEHLRNIERVEAVLRTAT